MTDNGVQFSLPAAKPSQSVFSLASHQPSEKTPDQLNLQQAEKPQPPLSTTGNVGVMINQSMDMVKLMLESAIPPQALPVQKSVFTLDKPLNGNAGNAKPPKKSSAGLLEGLFGPDWLETFDGAELLNDTASTVQDLFHEIQGNVQEAMGGVDAMMQKLEDHIVKLDMLADDKIDQVSHSAQNVILKLWQSFDRKGNS